MIFFINVLLLLGLCICMCKDLIELYMYLLVYCSFNEKLPQVLTHHGE